MKVRVGIAVTIVALLVAHQAAAQGGGATSVPEPPLDRFTVQYGFPTFPRLARPRSASEVPFIFNGPDYNALRIGDLSKAPIVESAKPPESHP
jgi:hypothetical protein